MYNVVNEELTIRFLVKVIKYNPKIIQIYTFPNISYYNYIVLFYYDFVIEKQPSKTETLLSFRSLYSTKVIYLNIPLSSFSTQQSIITAAFRLHI